MRQSVFRITCTAAALLAVLTGCSQHDAQQVRQAVQQEQKLTWTGDVDDTATVYVQGAKSWTDNVTEKGVQNVVAQFQGSLPSTEIVTVNLAGTSGRGQVAITQQPTRDNNYTAAVRIVDLQPGSDHYRFVLTW